MVKMSCFAYNLQVEVIMRNYSKIYLLIGVVTLPGFSSVSTQNDWSGGDGAGGPVTQWDNQYSWAYSVCTDIAGEVTLGALVDPEIHPLNMVCGEIARWVDVNKDGCTDVIFLNSSRDSLYWLENPVTQGAPWLRHHITTQEYIWDFGEAMYQGEYYGVVVAYTTSYEDETLVSLFYGPYYWVDIGTLGDKDYSVSLETGDLDNNGYYDIVAAKYAWDEVVVWWNCAAGIPEAIMGPHTPFVTQMEDCDGDGDLEIFIETGWTPSSRIYWNTSSGFQGQYIGDCYFTTRKAVADLDGGAFSEIAFSMFNDLYIYRFTSEDGWELQKIASNTSTPLFYDINEDGESDIITFFGGELIYLYNLGQGNTWREGRFSAGIPARLASTDIDGDSTPDIALYFPDCPAYWVLPQGEGYASEGFLESTWLNPETDLGWNSISFESYGAPGTEVTIQVRSATDVSSPPDWSPELASGSDITAYCSGDDENFQYRLNLYSNSTDESPTVVSVSLDWTTSVEQPSESAVFSFLPLSNPSQLPQLLIQLPNESRCCLKIYDVAGRLCRSSVLTVFAGEERLCAIPSLPAGVYHASLLAGNRELHTRFVVTSH